MIKNSDSLKSRLKNKSKEVNIPSEILLKIFMFERLLMRISTSKYKDNFILKGGFLISSIFGISLRTTVDIDITLKGLSLSKESLEDIIKDICRVEVADNCTFEVIAIDAIRAEKVNNGFSVGLKVIMDKVWIFINMDITTGDQITYREVEYDYITILEKEKISIMSYNNETILAEKFHAILSRGINNTRMKDYYDLYIFTKLKFSEIDKKTLRDAITNTAKNRDALHFINDSENIINQIENNEYIKTLWKQYQIKFIYAKDIDFMDVINAIKTIKDIGVHTPL